MGVGLSHCSEDEHSLDRPSRGPQRESLLFPGSPVPTAFRRTWAVFEPHLPSLGWDVVVVTHTQVLEAIPSFLNQPTNQPTGFGGNS